MATNNGCERGLVLISLISNLLIDSPQGLKAVNSCRRIVDVSCFWKWCDSAVPLAIHDVTDINWYHILGGLLGSQDFAWFAVPTSSGEFSIAACGLLFALFPNLPISLVWTSYAEPIGDESFPWKTDRRCSYSWVITVFCLFEIISSLFTTPSQNLNPENYKAVWFSFRPVPASDQWGNNFSFCIAFGNLYRNRNISKESRTFQHSNNRFGAPLAWDTCSHAYSLRGKFNSGDSTDANLKVW